MTARLHLVISTPLEVLVDDGEVAAVRAEDDSGGFGILPGHVDLLTMLPASVVRWRGADNALHFCALRAGLLTVRGGNRVAIACREGILGDEIHGLEAKVAALREAQIDADRRARVEETRLHARALRQIIRTLRPRRPGGLEHPPSIAPDGGGPQ